MPLKDFAVAPAVHAVVLLILVIEVDRDGGRGFCPVLQVSGSGTTLKARTSRRV